MAGVQPLNLSICTRDILHPTVFFFSSVAMFSGREIEFGTVVPTKQLLMSEALDVFVARICQNANGIIATSVYKPERPLVELLQKHFLHVREVQRTKARQGDI
jgi:hypothetical protein